MTHDPDICARLILEARTPVSEGGPYCSSQQLLRGLADQLEAAMAEVERTEAECDIDCEAYARNYRTVTQHSLRAKPVVDAAEKWRASGQSAAATLVLVSTVDAYRAARGKVER